MTKASPKDMITIQVAAKALGVSRGTVIQYLDEGRLRRIKEGSGIYLLMDEIRDLLDGMGKTGPGAITDSSSKSDGATVTVERDHYEGLLTRLGQLESENQSLLRYKNDLVNIKAALDNKEKGLQETEAKLLRAEEELRRCRKMGWWKRLIGR